MASAHRGSLPPNRGDSAAVTGVHHSSGGGGDARPLHVDPVVIASTLVNGLRAATGLEHGLSKAAVRTLLQSLAGAMRLHDQLDPVIHALSEGDAPAVLLESSEDEARLTAALQDMSACKDDFQQRSWHLHDDRGRIERSLTELLTVLTGADPALCVRVLMQSDARYLEDLVLYYQMETRADLKRLLLRVCTAGAELGDRGALGATLLSTVLPTALAGDVRNRTDESLALDAAVLLTQLLAAPGELPRTHFEVLNRTFVEFLLEGIEGGDEQLSDVFMFLLLAFNLHVNIDDNDIVISVLMKRSESTNLTEKILILFNRDDDTVSVGETGRTVALGSATAKFLLDLFSKEETAGLFYTNDTNVLIDVLVRQIHDLPPGDKKRLSALSLMLLVVRNTDYASSQHKSSELVTALRRIDATCQPGAPDMQLAGDLRRALAATSVVVT